MNRIAPTLTHAWIWQAIDTLASRKGLSPSGLAKLADLDPTTFNPSKRFTPEGRPRWPSTESIAKILAATQTSLDEFAEINDRVAPGSVAEEPDAHPLDDVPVMGRITRATVIPLRAAKDGKTAAGEGASVATITRFAVAVGDESLEPVYSRGNTLIVSRAEKLKAGDRVIIKAQGLPPLPRILLKESPRQIELSCFTNDMCRMRLKRKAIEWIARIVWVKQ
ncbi:MAG: S24 family peptidase [Hyphomicrobiaceae bacterium]